MASSLSTPSHQPRMLSYSMPSRLFTRQDSSGSSMVPLENTRDPKSQWLGLGMELMPEPTSGLSYWTDLSDVSKACSLLQCMCVEACRGNCKCHQAGLHCSPLCKCACEGGCTNSANFKVKTLPIYGVIMEPCVDCIIWMWSADSTKCSK